MELAESITLKIEKVKKIKESVKDSGITNKEAIYARLHPKLSTAKDIAKISHRAGVEQAKIGAGISLIKNVVAVSKGEKEAKDAAVEFVKETGKGAVTAYTTAFAGSTIKACMQNATNSTIRAISKTNAPAMIVTSTIDISTSLIRFTKGEISGADCLTEIGEKGTGSLCSAMFAVIGQAVIPIPIVGAMIGSMIGYTLSTTFYSTLKSSLQNAQLAHEERIRIEAKCAETIELIKQYRTEMNLIAHKYLKHYTQIFNSAFDQMDRAFLSNDINQFIKGVNDITIALGGDTNFKTLEQFNEFMESKEEFTF